MINKIAWFLFFLLEIPCAVLVIRAAYLNPRHLPTKVNNWIWVLGVDWVIMIILIAFLAFVEPRLRNKKS